tara:strand:+ start:93 stop:287 length:195 start_codon:yes stop_codon:yes gene_type:complete
MIPSKAIKVYESAGQPDGEFVTTVFTPYDAQRIKLRLFNRRGVRRVIFKSVTGKVLSIENNNRI